MCRYLDVPPSVRAISFFEAVRKVSPNGIGGRLNSIRCIFLGLTMEIASILRCSMADAYLPAVGTHADRSPTLYVRPSLKLPSLHRSEK